MCCSGGGGGGVQQQAPTPQEHALAETGAKEFNRYVDAFVPATADYLDATSAKESDRLSLAGGVAGELARTTAGRRTDADLVASGLRGGFAPSAGRTVFGMSDASTAYSSGLSRGVAQLRPALVAREVGGLQKVVSSGRGLSDQSTAGLAAVGRASLSDALSHAEASFRAKEADLGLRQGLVSGLATAGGMYARHQGLGVPPAPAVMDRSYVMTPGGTY